MDARYTLGRAMIAAWLNILAGNEHGCIDGDLIGAINWMLRPDVRGDLASPSGFGGFPVKPGGRNSLWRDGEPYYLVLDEYNNGLLCAPSRDALA